MEPNGWRRWKWVIILMWPSVIGLATVGAVMWRDIALAQRDVKEIQKDDVETAEAVKQIPEMAKDIEYIKEKVDDFAGFAEDVRDHIMKDAVNDATYHHEHNPR